MKNYQDLADLVGDYLSKNDLSEDDLKRRSNGEISQGYVNNIKNRKVDPVNITLKKLRALARAMRTSETLIINLALGVTKETSLSDQFKDLLAKLPPNRQKDLLKFAELFAAESEEEQIVQVNQTELTPVDQKDYSPQKFNREGLPQDQINFQISEKKKAG